MKPPSFLHGYFLFASSFFLGGASWAVPCMQAQEASISMPAEEISSIEGGETSLLIAPSLQALWVRGGATDFSDAAWEERVGVSLDRWDSVMGRNVSDLTGSAAFYGASSYGERLLGGFGYDPAQSVADHANGVRMRGLLVIPEDGEYSFALAGDDAADLYLGEPGGSRFTKKKALSVPTWTNYRDWTSYRTAGKSCKAGDVIWIEVIGKNDEGAGGGEHYSVAWKKPGDTEYSLIPVKMEDGRIVLSTPPVDPEDANDIGVPGSWLSSVGLGGASAANDPRARLYGDVDGDGFNLLEEYQTGGRPDTVGGNTGYFSVEKWTGACAGSVEGFTKGERFTQAPNEVRKREGGLDVSDSGDNYFARLRAMVAPPLTGEWTFFIAGDDTARLLLSRDGSRFGKRPVAEVSSYTNPHEWNKSSGQKTAPLVMKTGEEYFLEALQYQQGGGAHVSVAWQYKAPNLCRMEGAISTQSSTAGEGSASYAIDGDMSTQSHTNWTTENSWWQVDFGSEKAMNQVVVYNISGGTNNQRLSNFRISVLDAKGEEVAGKDFYTESGTYAGEVVTWDLPKTLQGKIVRIQGLGMNNHGDKYLCLREVEVTEQNEYSRAPAVISGEHIQTIPAEPNDLDNNSLPDDWQAEKGLVAGQNGLSVQDCGEYGDPDGDLIPNFAEHLLGSNPLVPSGAPGYLTQEMWWNVAGWSVDDAMKSAEVLGRVPQRSLLKGGQPPQNVGDNYFRRLRGTIKAPVTGDYTFWISSDETSVLYLSTDDRKFHKREIARLGYGEGDRGVYLAAYNQWDAFPKQRSQPVHLEEGKEYFIEADHKQYHAVNHVQIAWQMPGGQRELIPGEAFTSFGGDLADRDDDDLPDEWEVQYGIKADDNGGKDFNNGAWGDPYNTGITNREAYLLGWDPRNPSLPDFGDMAVDVPVTGGTSGIGSWTPSGTGILTPMGRGSISYTVNIPDGCRYLLEITGSPTGNVLEVETLSIGVQVDDLSLGINTLRSIKGASGRVLFLLPVMTPGSHTFTVTLKNTDLRRSFQINGIRLLKPEGQSADGCNLPEWLHQYIGQENALTSCPAESLTSPLCVEGKSRVLHLASLTAGGQAQKLNAGTGTGWYANVALPADGSALPVEATFESGAHNTSSTVKWEACDMLTHSELTIRKGDRLRLTVGTGLPATLAMDDRVWENATGEPVEVCFDTPGVKTVTASWSVPAENSSEGAGGGLQKTKLTVHVVEAELGEARDLITGLTRTLTLTSIPDAARLQALPPVHLAEIKAGQPAGTRIAEVRSDKGGGQHLVARLGEGGPIIDTLALFSHDNSGSSTLSSVEPMQDFADGSSLVCLYLASESLPAGGYVKIRLTAGGVQFLQGGTELIVRAEDFGPDGLYRVLMTVPPGTTTSICHVISYYDKNGNRL